jgi:hypothetical protein
MQAAHAFPFLTIEMVFDQFHGKKIFFSKVKQFEIPGDNRSVCASQIKIIIQ